MHYHYRLLEILSDGQFHSGETLGARLGVTRAAIWKQLRGLQESGLAVHSVRGKGHRLAQPLELLDRDRILAVMEAAGGGAAPLEVFPEIPSTNDHLRGAALGGAPAGSACVAERQTRGRGRRGRPWISPFGANLYLSQLWRFPGDLASLSGLSLAVGVALVRTLEHLGVEGAGLKWPNDVLADGGKLAGVLIDLAGEATGPCQVVIGIGVNVRMPAQSAREIDQSWTDLYSLTGGQTISRNELAGQMLAELTGVLGRFEETGFRGFLDEWRRFDLTQDREVELISGPKRIKGRSMGVDASGALLLDAAGDVQAYSSGEISLRIAS